MEGKKRLRRSFTTEYKAEVVALCRSGGKSIGQVCRDLDLTETVVRRWVAQAEIDSGQRGGMNGKLGRGRVMEVGGVPCG